MSQPCFIFRGDSYYVTRDCADYVMQLEEDGESLREAIALALHEFSYITNEQLELFRMAEERGLREARQIPRSEKQLA